MLFLFVQISIKYLPWTLVHLSFPKGLKEKDAKGFLVGKRRRPFFFYWRRNDWIGGVQELKLFKLAFGWRLLNNRFFFSFFVLLRERCRRGREYIQKYTRDEDGVDRNVKKKIETRWSIWGSKHYVDDVEWYWIFSDIRDIRIIIHKNFDIKYSRS